MSCLSQGIVNPFPLINSRNFLKSWDKKGSMGCPTFSHAVWRRMGDVSSGTVLPPVSANPILSRLRAVAEHSTSTVPSLPSAHCGNCSVANPQDAPSIHVSLDFDG